MRKGHAGPDLEICRLGVKKLLGKTPDRARRHAEGGGGIVAEDHGRILKKMLDEDVLASREMPRSAQTSEGDEGLEEALAKAAGAGPFP